MLTKPKFMNASSGAAAAAAARTSYVMDALQVAWQRYPLLINYYVDATQWQRSPFDPSENECMNARGISAVTAAATAFAAATHSTMSQIN